MPDEPHQPHPRGNTGAATLQSGATPDAFSSLLSSHQVLTTDGDAWRDITLQRHVVPAGSAQIPAAEGPRLVLQLRGTVFFDGHYEGRRLSRWCGAGHCYVWPAGASLTRDLSGQADGVIVHLSSSFVSSITAGGFDRDPARMALIERVGVFDPVLEQVTRLLLNEAETGGQGGRLMVESLATSLAVHLLRCHSSDPRGLQTRVSGMARVRFRSVIDYMQDNIDEQISLASLSEMAGLSSAQFVRSFRATTGNSPYQYLLQLRISRARELLGATKLSVIEVGFRCGFGDPSHFATAFRRATGVTPSRWRAIHQG